MRIGRVVIIPAILALGVAGSAVAGSAIAMASVPSHVHVSGSHVQAMGASADPNIYYHT
jgi:hypothetical protein